MLRGSPTTSNIDPIAVRIIMIALLFTGVGLVAYLIAWIAIPSAEEGRPEPPAEPEVRHRTAAILGATLVASWSGIPAARPEAHDACDTALAHPGGRRRSSSCGLVVRNPTPSAVRAVTACQYPIAACDVDVGRMHVA
jgi:PspC domain